MSANNKALQNEIHEAAQSVIDKFDALPPTLADTIPALGLNRLRLALLKYERDREL